MKKWMPPLLYYYPPDTSCTLLLRHLGESSEEEHVSATDVCYGIEVLIYDSEGTYRRST